LLLLLASPLSIEMRQSIKEDAWQRKPEKEVDPSKTLHV
jgi:hypothetical protein